MLLTVHDKNMRKLGFLSNELPDATHYKDDLWTRFRKTGLSTFSLTIPKEKGDANHIKLEEAAHISFTHNQKDYAFFVIHAKETKSEITLDLMNIYADLVYEASPKIDAKESQTLIWYLEQSRITNAGQLTVNINEIPTRKRKLKYDSEDTSKLARLQDIMESFDAEFEFETVLHDSGELKEILLNIYHEQDEWHDGLGSRRTDLPSLHYHTGLDGIEREISYEGIFNAIEIIGKDGKKFTHVEMEQRNADGQVEIFKKNDSNFFHNPISANLFPSQIKMKGYGNNDAYRSNVDRTEYTQDSQAIAHAVRFLRENAYPKIEYRLTTLSEIVKDYAFDLEVGDTWVVSNSDLVNDDGSKLFLEFRLDTIAISFSNPSRNTIEFSNFKKLKSTIGKDLYGQVERLIEKSQPYVLDVSTSKGTMFKNRQGQTVVRPLLSRLSSAVPEATYRFTLDGRTTEAEELVVDAGMVQDSTVAVVEAVAEDRVVARQEITLMNVNDGRDGAKGPQGEPGPQGSDGKTAYFYVSYADSDTGGGFSLTDHSKRYMGYYSSHETTQSQVASRYTWIDRSNVPATFMQSTAPVNPPVGSRWKYTGSSNLTANGATIKPSEQYLFVGGKWIKDIITSDNLDIKDQFIQGEMIKDGAVTVEKLSVQQLSAVTSDLGDITAGTLSLVDKRSEVSISETFLNEKATVYRKRLTGGKDEVMLLDSGNLEFYYGDYNQIDSSQLSEHLRQQQHTGLIGTLNTIPPKSPFSMMSADRAVRKFGIRTKGDLIFEATNYTDWQVSKHNPKVAWMVQGRQVTVYMDVTFTSAGNKGLAQIPIEFIAGPARFPALAYHSDSSRDRHCQLSADGGLFLLNPVVGQRYVCYITWFY